jgi:hypothetical protein
MGKHMKRGASDDRVADWARYAVVIFLLLNQIALAPNKAIAEQQSAKVTASRSACPSKDFTKFFDAFAENVEIQKTFTQLPLTYGLLDLSEIPLPKFSRRKIASFDMIPSYNTEDSGAIFPTQAVRVKFNNLIYMGNGSGVYQAATWRDYTAGANVNIGTGVNSVSVLLTIENTAVGIYYRFHRSNKCWTLYEIDDRST